MPNQTIPITNVWGPVPTDFKADDINQLGELIAQQLSSAIRTDVTFIPLVTNDPAAYQGQLVFNVTQSIFKSWSIASGAYLAVTPFTNGDVKNTFVGTDSPGTGWIILNGRLISDVVGFTPAQVDVLKSLFGSAITDRIPNVTPANVSGLPQGNAFGAIPWGANLNPTVLPAAGTISPGLTFSNPVTDTEGQALASNCEILRTSTDQAFEVTKQIQAKCQDVLTALNANTTPPLYAAMFVGYP